jgi:hypothetical protein
LVSFTIKVDIDEALTKLKGIDVSKILKEELHKGGDLIMTDAKENVHVVSGDLKASGRVEKREHEVHGGFTKDYAALEEKRQGGRRGGSHAYLQPAVDKNGPIIFRNMQDKIKGVLN